MNSLELQKILNDKTELLENNSTLEDYQEIMDDLKILNEARKAEGFKRLNMPNITASYMMKLLPFAFKQERTDEHQNDLFESFYDIDRYYFDSKLCPLGFKQFDTDQDASYFGIWVNADLLCTVTYCEGDITFCQCTNEKNYNNKIQGYIDDYDEGQICSVIDLENSKSTTYKQDRTQFLISENNEKDNSEPKETSTTPIKKTKNRPK